MATFTIFYDWLAKHKSLRTPVGEFAREAMKDAAFPKDLTTLEGLLAYLGSAPNTSSQTLSKARVAWRAFERGR